MRKRGVLLLPILLALLIAPIATKATDLGLQFSSGGHTLQFCDNNIAFAGCTPMGSDGDSTLGVIKYDESLGNWTINKGNGFGPPFEVQPQLLDLSSFNATTTNGHGADALTILLTATNLTGPLGNFNFVDDVGGASSAGTTVFTTQGWMSTTNQPFCGAGCGTPITSLLTMTGTAFNGESNGSGSTGAGPYSVTLRITIDSNGPDQTSFSNSLDQFSIPEPGTLSLLGAGFLGLGTGLGKFCRRHGLLRATHRRCCGRRLEAMKKTVIAVLASLMLAGVLAGASDPVTKMAPSTVFALTGSSAPVLVNAPILATYGDSTSR